MCFFFWNLKINWICSSFQSFGVFFWMNHGGEEACKKWHRRLIVSYIFPDFILLYFYHSIPLFFLFIIIIFIILEKCGLNLEPLDLFLLMYIFLSLRYSTSWAKSLRSSRWSPLLSVFFMIYMCFMFHMWYKIMIIMYKN